MVYRPKTLKLFALHPDSLEQRVLAIPLDRMPVSSPRLNALQKPRRARLCGVKPAARDGSLQRKAPLDIFGTECIARKPDHFGKCGFHVAHAFSHLVYGLGEHPCYLRALEA